MKMLVGPPSVFCRVLKLFFFFPPRLACQSCRSKNVVCDKVLPTCGTCLRTGTVCCYKERKRWTRKGKEKERSEKEANQNMVDNTSGENQQEDIDNCHKKRRKLENENYSSSSTSPFHSFPARSSPENVSPPPPTSYLPLAPSPPSDVHFHVREIQLSASSFFPLPNLTPNLGLSFSPVPPPTPNCTLKPFLSSEEDPSSTASLTGATSLPPSSVNLLRNYLPEKLSHSVSFFFFFSFFFFSSCSFLFLFLTPFSGNEPLRIYLIYRLGVVTSKPPPTPYCHSTE